jgi:hypothetical protein
VGDEEITNAAYRSLSETVKAELLGLHKGRLLVRHAHFRAPLFGTFPLPPTIPGMAGKRVFNDGGIASVPNSHPGDAIFLMLQRQMGDRAPRQHEVRTETEGCDAAFLAEVCAKVEREYLRLKQRNGLTRATPWSMVKNQLSQKRNRFVR